MSTGLRGNFFFFAFFGQSNFLFVLDTAHQSHGHHALLYDEIFHGFKDDAHLCRVECACVVHKATPRE
jgi:hypothetical protein